MVKRLLTAILEPPMIFRLLIAVLALWSAVDAFAAEKSRHVLLIGVDGTRYDALQKAETPNFDRLIKAGALSDDCQILGERYQKNETISGPGWSSILTGVWADKHGTQDNDFKTPNYKEYPHFFQRVKGANPKAFTVSIDSWEPIKTYIVSDADINESFAKAKDEHESELDKRVLKRGIEVLKNENPTAMFFYFHQVDSTGHGRGFHPTVPEYITAIENVDAGLGQLIEALESRPNRANEDWLVVICTDHGGRGTKHSGGHTYPEIRQTWLICWHPGETIGKTLPPTEHVDIVPTLLEHLQVPVQAEWKLDGKPVGWRGE
jgi:hypothetical protein